jgi:hypothetical protein
VVLRSLDIDSVAPYEGGRPWGKTGPYEWVEATATFATDPTRPDHSRIVDLDLAPREPDGTVRFESDVRLLRPADGEGNGRLLVVIPNRGRLGGVPFSIGGATGFAPAETPLPGDGFVLDRGWTVAWCGWQWDVPGDPGLIGFRAPEVAVEPGSIRLEWRLDNVAPTHALSDSSALFSFASYPTADTNDKDAQLTARTSPDGERSLVPRSSWRFQDPTTISLDGGFQPFIWYELIYRTSRCPIAGTGMLAIADLVSDLRARGSFDHVLAYGISQSGRLLRQFLFDGLNLDDNGQSVFDGVFAHIAGGRRGEFNHRYAQPSLTHVIGFSNLPPYDTTGLLELQRQRGGVPKAFFTNTAFEYWRGDGALVHVDPVTGDDLPDDPDARVYLLAGTDHLGAMPMKQDMPGANPVHALDVQPILRALFVALEKWVCDGVEPPASQVPRRAEGTAVTRSEVLKRFRRRADVHLPDPAVLNVTRQLDLGPDAGRGIGRWPISLGGPVPALVSATDDDGNEVAGIRLPAVAAPTAVYTGWNPRRPLSGLPDVLYEMLGSQLPLPVGTAKFTERYPNRDEYARAARLAATTLVTERFLLDSDIDLAVDQALAIYDMAIYDTVVADRTHLT